MRIFESEYEIDSDDEKLPSEMGSWHLLIEKDGNSPETDDEDN